MAAALVSMTDTSAMALDSVSPLPATLGQNAQSSAVPSQQSPAQSAAYHSPYPRTDGLPSSTDDTPSTQGGMAFGLLKPGVATADGPSGQYKDGRVRNPVPSKLKGKTDKKKGNFIVMHMDLTDQESTKSREGAAKRTSESTELAAKRAFQHGYVPLTKRRSYVAENLQPKPPASSEGSASPATAGNIAARLPSRTLNPVETKEEQARLLTLLRSLSPVVVVNQICTALAYFGGIPGAVAPANGAFPESAGANGSGGLFVGWLAEIFPKLDGNRTFPTDPAQNVEADTAPEPRPKIGRPPNPSKAVKEKRPRGRPKGSKATKVRKDKGIKKGPLKDRPGTGTTAFDGQPGDNAAGEADENWVDVDDSVLGGPGNIGDTSSFFALEGTASTQQTPSSAQVNRTVTTPSSRPILPDGSMANSVTGSGKKRGRPRGSKNRPKDEANATTATAPPTAPTVPATITPIPPPVIPGLSMIPKAKPMPPKPKVTKKKPVEPVTWTPPGPQHNGDVQAPGNAHTHSQNGGNAVARQIDGTDFALSALQTFETTLDPSSQTTSFASANTASTPQSQQTSNKVPEAGVAGVKRKRNRAPKKADKAQDAIANTNVVAAANSDLSIPNGSVHGGRDTGSVAQVTETASVAPPPPKRQRKSKEPKASLPNNKVSQSKKQSTPTSIGTTIIPQAAEAPIMSPLAADESESHFDAASFDALASHFDQNTTPVQHHSEHLPSLAPTSHQQQSQQRQHQSQVATPDMSTPIMSTPTITTPTLLPQTGDHLQGIGRQQKRSQSQQQVQPQQQQTPTHTLSPVPQQTSQAQIPNAIVPSSVASQPSQQQHGARSSQGYYTQSRSNSSQYGQTQQQQPQQQQQQSQQPTPQFSTQQSQAQYASQQPKQPQYATQYQTQHQYSPQLQQPQYSSQPRQQNVSTSSPGLMAQSVAHQSPQFGPTSTTTLGPTSATYGGHSAGAMSFSSSYGARRTPTSVSPSLNAYGTTPSHTMSHHNSHSPSFGTSRQQTSTPSHVQNVASVAQNMQNFHGFDNTSLFDNISLDPSTSHGGLGLNATSYSMSGSVPRTSNNNGAFGSTSAMNTFDTSLGANDLRDHRYYGVRR